MRRNPGFTFLNVLGLTLGLTSCLVIFLIVRYETEFDTFHNKANDIYRVTWHRDDFNASVSLGIAPALRNDFVDIERVSQVWLMGPGIVKTDQKLFEEGCYAFADANFPQIFDYEWLAGNPLTALSEPGTIVLTEGLARKYFSQTDPLGKVLTVSNPNYHKKYDVTVTGILKDLPANTHLPFSFLVSYQTLKKDLGEQMFNFYTIVGASTYLLLSEEQDVQQLEKKMPGFLLKNWGEEIAKENQLLLQPLKEIHFDQRYVGTTANYTYTTTREIIWALGAVGAFILLMACINFINLSTAISARRSKEVGIRKTLGGSRRQIFTQFLMETSFIVVLSLVASVIVSIISLQYVDQWLNIKLKYTALTDSTVVPFILGVALIVICLSGIYPAYVQSAFNPVQALKNRTGIKAGSLNLRNGLVTLQFIISQSLIIGTLVVGYQMNYLRNQDLGFAKDAIVSFDLPAVSKWKLLKQRLVSEPGIGQASFSSGAPSYNNFFTPVHSAELGLIRDEVAEIRFVDENYTNLFGLKMLAGQKIANLSDNRSNFADTNSLRPIVINETLLHKLGLHDPEEAIGKKVTIYWNYRAIIQGVIQDFQSESRHKERRPCILLYAPERFISAAVKLQGSGVHQTLSRIEELWSNLFPDNIFKYEFLDDHIAATYKREEYQYTVFGTFSIIAILIGCLGLYGLVAFTAFQRTKEIGIRKVLGASTQSITALLSMNFLQPVLLGGLIAVPITWFFMDKWLENFAYHISISWWIILVGVTLSLLIALATVGQQAMKVALANPIKSLRTE